MGQRGEDSTLRLSYLAPDGEATPNEAPEPRPSGLKDVEHLHIGLFPPWVGTVGTDGTTRYIFEDAAIAALVGPTIEPVD